MLKFIRRLKKSLIERVPSSYFETLTAITYMNENFSIVRSVKKFKNREDLWKDVFDKFNGEAITVLEFGVYKGYSIKKFAEFNTNENSKFFGFDSFEGLPENWTRIQPKGTFSIDGNQPIVDDN